jgi:(p)ppGpp synthase/HD superfamily hydrolase
MRLSHKEATHDQTILHAFQGNFHRSSRVRNKEDLAGAPYILHLLHVMDSVKHLGYEAMTAAVLHDLLEDIPGWSGERLSSEGMSDTIVSTVMLLTRKSGVPYELYIESLYSNKLAIEIKLADLRHNIDPLRLNHVSQKDYDRIYKYHVAYKYLMNIRMG